MSATERSATALTSCKKSEKTNEQSQRYLKTDGPWTDGRTDQRTMAITKDPLGRTRGPIKRDRLYILLIHLFRTVPIHFLHPQHWTSPRDHHNILV